MNNGLLNTYLIMDAININEKFEKEIMDITNRILNKTKAYNEIINHCNMKLDAYRVMINQKGFKSKEDEIQFFKYTKQLPLLNLIYYSELQVFEYKFPKIGKRQKRKYIQKATNKINSFFNDHNDFIRYISLDQTYLDEQFFTRKFLSSFTFAKSLFYYQDPKFHTSHDCLLAKSRAYQKMVPYLQNRLENLEQPSLSNKSSLHWTASKVALTELTYALYHSKSVNGGHVELKEIAHTLQKAFNFELGDFYRTYTEIRARKKSRVKFLDELSISLISNLDLEDK